MLAASGSSLLNLVRSVPRGRARACGVRAPDGQAVPLAELPPGPAGPTTHSQETRGSRDSYAIIAAVTRGKEDRNVPSAATAPNSMSAASRCGLPACRDLSRHDAAHLPRLVIKTPGGEAVQLRVKSTFVMGAGRQGAAPGAPGASRDYSTHHSRAMMTPERRKERVRFPEEAPPGSRGHVGETQTCRAEETRRAADLAHSSAPPSSAMPASWGHLRGRGAAGAPGKGQIATVRQAGLLGLQQAQDAGARPRPHTSALRVCCYSLEVTCWHLTPPAACGEAPSKHRASLNQGAGKGRHGDLVMTASLAEWGRPPRALQA